MPEGSNATFYPWGDAPAMGCQLARVRPVPCEDGGTVNGNVLILVLVICALAAWNAYKGKPGGLW